MQSKYLMFFAAGLLGVSTLASAEDVGHGVDVSGNIAFTTDYRFRGISQTDEKFAVQGGFDVAHESGLYAGTWASNVDNFNGADTELDLYAGYGFGLTDALALDFNVLYFYYPGASTAGGTPEINYVEYTPGISYSTDLFSGSFSVSYSPDFYAESGDSFYYNLSGDVPLAAGFSLGAHAGYQNIEDNAAFGTPSYTDWSLSINKSLAGLDFSLAYVDTELSDRECFGGSGLCDATAVLSVAKSL